MALRDVGRASMAYFYFDFRDVDKQKLSNLLPSLLVQLSAQSDPCCDKLSQLYSAHDSGVQRPSDHAMAECLKQMLALEGQGPTYIFLDALDECPVTSTIVYRHREKKSSSWLRILLDFIFPTSTSLLQVGQSRTFKL